MSSSIRGKRSWHDDRRRWRCAAYCLDQAPEVPLQCLRLPQLGVVSPRWITTAATLSSSFRIAGICTETSRTRAPGRQWVCTLPSANVARTCRTIESPMTTASRSVSQRGAKRVPGWDVEDRGGEKSSPGAWIASSAAAPRVRGFPAPEWRPSVTIASRVHGACAEKQHGSRGGGSVSSVLHTYPGLMSVSPRCSSVLSVSSAGPVSPSSSRIRVSTASSSSCAECSSNVSSTCTQR